MARKIRYVGLPARDRSLAKRKSKKSKKISADDVLKYIDKGLEYAGHPLVSSVVQGLWKLGEPSKEDIIEEQKEDLAGKDFSAITARHKAAAAELAADQPQLLQDVASGVAYQDLEKAAAAKAVEEDWLAIKGAELLSSGAQLQALFGYQQPAPTTRIRSPEPGVVSPVATVVPPVILESQAPKGAYKPNIVEEGVFRPQSTRDLEAALAAAKLTPAMEKKLADFDKAIDKDPAIALPQVIAEVLKLKGPKPSIQGMQLQQLDLYKSRLKDIIARQYPVKIDPKGAEVLIKELTPKQELTLDQLVEQITNKNPATLTPEEKEILERWARLNTTLEDISPGEVPVPSPLPAPLEERPGQGPARRPVHEGPQTSIPAGGFVEVPGSRMAAAGGATPLPAPPTAVRQRPLRRQLQLPATEAYTPWLQQPALPAAPSPEAPPTAPPQPAYIDVPEPYEAGLHAEEIRAGMVSFLPNIHIGAEPDPKAIAQHALSAIGTDELRKSQMAPEDLEEWQRLSQMITARVPSFDEVYPELAAPAAPSAPKKVLPSILPYSTWEETWTIAKRISDPQEQQRLLDHAENFLTNPPGNIFELIAGRSSLQEKNMKILVNQFQKQKKAKSIDPYTLQKKQIDIQRAKQKYQIDAGKFTRNQAKASADLRLKYARLKKLQAGGSRAAIKTAKEAQKLLRSSRKGMGSSLSKNTNILKKLEKDYEKRAYASYKKSGSLDSKLNTLHSELVSSKIKQQQATTAIPSAETELAYLKNPTEQADRLQQLKFPSAYNARVRTAQAKVDKLTEAVKRESINQVKISTAIDNMRNQKVALDSASEQYNYYSTVAAEIKDIRSRTDRQSALDTLQARITADGEQ